MSFSVPTLRRVHAVTTTSLLGLGAAIAFSGCTAAEEDTASTGE